MFHVCISAYITKHPAVGRNKIEIKSIGHVFLKGFYCVKNEVFVGWLFQCRFHLGYNVVALLALVSLDLHTQFCSLSLSPSQFSTVLLLCPCQILNSHKQIRYGQNICTKDKSI